jgi:hypothetical protein
MATHPKVKKEATQGKDKKQKGRQFGSSTGKDAMKSNSQEFFRHPGQNMRGKEGGAREAARDPAQETTGSDTRKKSRPKNER